MKSLDELISKARDAPKRIVLAEGEDLRIIEAAANAHQQGIAEIFLLGNKDSISDQARRAGFDLAGIELINPSTSSRADHYASALYQARKHKGLSDEKASELIRNPLFYAMMMVRQGDVDGCVVGAVYTSADVVRAALQLVGKHEDYDLVSSCFIMLMNKPFHSIKGAIIFADCGLNIDPDAEQLAQIALTSADSAKNLLGLEPLVAMLSFSTNQSANHPLVDKIIQATEIARKAAPDLKIIGEVQLDAALVPEIHQQKTDSSDIQLPANVLVFPNLEAGNIGYKLAERLGQAEAIGPILQGLKRPVNDLSRGCNTQDVFNVIAVTVVQALS